MTSPYRLLLAAALVAATLPALGGVATAAEEPITDQPVVFHVKNINSSRVYCPADNAAYDVVGHLTGPSSVVHRGRIAAATLYVHGDAVDESLWRYDKVPGYNYVAEMAKRGFVSVTISRLGYTGSGKPNGNKVCLGSEADVAHQIVVALRHGSYNVGNATHGPLMQKVALAGHSASGFAVMAEAYSFGGIDDLVVIGSGQFVKPRAPQAVFDQQTRCASAADGYALIEATGEQAAADFFHDADPAIVADVTAHRPPDSCAGLMFIPSNIISDSVFNRQVTVPVLLITGDSDAFFDDPAQEAALFTDSLDVKSVLLPNTGHAITLGHSAPQFRDQMAAWLDEHGLDAGG
ncbi:MAG TPA: alpha/beta hydrolase [Sporichthyaceae bacterium]|nr:alpha/beta hydrolase [Sporichthyaceae bacterium]